MRTGPVVSRARHAVDWVFEDLREQVGPGDSVDAGWLPGGSGALRLPQLPRRRACRRGDGFRGRDHPLPRLRVRRKYAVISQASNARRGHQRRQASEQFVGREQEEERPGAGSFHAVAGAQRAHLQKPRRGPAGSRRLRRALQRGVAGREAGLREPVPGPRDLHDTCRSVAQPCVQGTGRATPVRRFAQPGADAYAPETTTGCVKRWVEPSRGWHVIRCCRLVARAPRRRAGRGHGYFSREPAPGRPPRRRQRGPWPSA
jgi:hypothetical protein